MRINRRRLKKQVKRNRWFRLGRFLAIEIGLAVFFLSFLLIVFHKQTKTLLNPINRVRSSIASALGVSDDTGEIQKLLEDRHIVYKQISSTGNETYHIILSEDEDVLVGGSQNLTVEINSLQVILNRLTMEGKRFDRLDLRFARPVIHLITT